VRRIGLLGGTFDPIHCGHLAAAVAARDVFGLDEVFLVPSHIPPHRAVQPIASPFHRFAMACLAVSGVSRLQASDEELRAEGLSYTADTLDRLHARGLNASQIFFITGADAFADIATWRRYPEVLALATFVVVARPGHALETLPSRLPALAGRMRPAAPPENDGIAGEPRIHLLETPTPDVSSTIVRDRLRRGETIDGLVPSLVEAHIRQHSLYITAENVPGNKAIELHGQNREN
jgi:nicotinate-nucleotide adenylyltransferase